MAIIIIIKRKDGLGSGMGKTVRAVDKADAMLTLSSAL